MWVRRIVMDTVVRLPDQAGYQPYAAGAGIAYPASDARPAELVRILLRPPRWPILLCMVRISNAVMNVKDAQRATDFWSRALGYRRAGEGSAVLLPPDGAGPRLVMDETDRTHLDLHTANAQEQRSEVERLISLGARSVPDWDYPPGADFVVLQDTEPNASLRAAGRLLTQSASPPQPAARASSVTGACHPYATGAPASSRRYTSGF